MSMFTYEKLKLVYKLFQDLEATSSRNDKLWLVDTFKRNYSVLSDDLEFCLEVLAGRHKVNFTLAISDFCKSCHKVLDRDGFCYNEECTCYDPIGHEYAPLISIKDFCEPLFTMTDHSWTSVNHINQLFRGYGWFLNPLFNRTWRLGISPSQLEKQDISPQLAKKFDPDKFPIDNEYYLTEKIDGNRCIARFNEKLDKWEFFSRSGKLMKVDFNMGMLPKAYIWDGEVVSESQYSDPSQGNFNATSGIINSKYGAKTGLIYLIFDFIYKISYKERRRVIGGILGQKSNNLVSKNVKILPVLATCNKDNLSGIVSMLLNQITSRGGEGVMINLGSAVYQNKRTDKLLKVKNVYTMDMKVIDIIPGTSKYEGLVGSLECFASDLVTGIVYSCQVGSGLSDYQREHWSFNPDEIIGKIVEVAYFSLSQDKLRTGSKNYSLRFPRLKRVRDDKTDTSVD